jgi:hypothetical protein
MASLSKAWGTVLSPSERDLWRIWGSQQNVQNRLGDTIQLSGIAAFNRVNLFRMSTLSQAMLTSPPEAMGGEDPAPTFVSVAGILSAENTPAAVDVSLNASSTGYSLAAYYAAPIPPGVQYYRGPYIGRTTQVVTTSPANVTLTNAIMPDHDLRVALKLTLYHTATGLPIWTVFTDPTVVPEGA